MSLTQEHENIKLFEVTFTRVSTGKVGQLVISSTSEEKTLSHFYRNNTGVIVEGVRTIIGKPRREWDQIDEDAAREGDAVYRFYSQFQTQLVGPGKRGRRVPSGTQMGQKRARQIIGPIHKYKD